MNTGLFKRNVCPRCGAEPRMFGTITVKEGLFSVKRTNNYTCSKCNYKWEEDK